MGQSFAPEQPDPTSSGDRIVDQLRLSDDQVRETVEALFQETLTREQLVNAVATGVLRADQFQQIASAYVAAGGSPMSLPAHLKAKSSPPSASDYHPDRSSGYSSHAASPEQSAASSQAPTQKFRIANLSHQQLLTPNQLTQLIDAIRAKLIHGLHVRLAYEDGRLNRAQVSQLLHAATRSSVTLDDINEIHPPSSAWPSEQEQVSAWERGTQLSGLAGSNVFEVVDPSDRSDDSFEASSEVFDQASGSFPIIDADPVHDALDDVDFHAVAIDDQLRERGRQRKRKRNTIAVLAAWIIASLLSAVTISIAVREYGRMEGATNAVSIWLTNEQLPLPDSEFRRRHGSVVDHTIRGNWLGRVFAGQTGDLAFDGAYSVMLWDETDGKKILLAEYLVGWRGSPREYILLGAINRLDPSEPLNVSSTPPVIPGVVINGDDDEQN